MRCGVSYVLEEFLNEFICKVCVGIVIVIFLLYQVVRSIDSLKKTEFWNHHDTNFNVIVSAKYLNYWFLHSRTLCLRRICSL